MPSKRQQDKEKKRAQKRERKRSAMQKPGEVSRYAKKKSFCTAHGVWGFEVTHKPWK